MVRGARPNSSAASFLAAAALIGAGILLRLPVFLYHGPRTQDAFNSYIFQYPGSYSDIGSLYFRDHLWRHPAPYFDYKFEYPVLTGAFVWLVGVVKSSVASYALASGAVLGGCALVVVRLVRKFPGSNVWILVLAPALAFDVMLNWDVLALVFAVGALLLYGRGRDGIGGGVLALAVWAKFFPLLLLPVVVQMRIRERRWRSLMAGLISFTVVSLAVNLPVALQRAAGGSGFVIRPGWEYFFRYNQKRNDVGNLWWFFSGLHLTTPQVNTASGVLLVGGMAVIVLAALRGAGHAPASSLMTPAFLGLLSWFFFVNKVYSPQYGLWVIVLLAILGADLWLAVAFVTVDAAYFVASFLSLDIQSRWFFPTILRPAAGVREVVLLGLVVWSLRYIVRPGSAKTSLAHAKSEG